MSLLQLDLLLWPDADPLALSLIESVYGEAWQIDRSAARVRRHWLDQPPPEPNAAHQLWLIGSDSSADQAPPDNVVHLVHQAIRCGQSLVALGSAVRWVESTLAPQLPATGLSYQPCRGGLATLPLLLCQLKRDHGEGLTNAVAHRLHLPALTQPLPPGVTLPAKVAAAIELMQANLEEPLTSDELAGLVGISRRQLERLFKQALQRVPSQFYLELRLNRARELLRTTATSIIQIGLSCGFSSGSHFSSAYRAFFGTSPRDERRRP